MNKLEFLDSPGEWYYDTASDMVYVWTPEVIRQQITKLGVLH